MSLHRKSIAEAKEFVNRQEFAAAVRRKDVVAVQNLLQTPGGSELVSMVVEKHSEATAVIVSARVGDVNVLTALLEAKASPLSCDRSRRCALHYASRNGHKQCVARLLRAGAPVDALDKKGESPLALACKTDSDVKGAAQVVAMLCSASADLHTPRALFHASRRGKTGVVTRLLEFKADVDERETDEGVTALTAACEEGHVDVVRVLVEHHADLSARDSIYQTTPLLAAVRTEDDAAVLRALVQSYNNYNHHTRGTGVSATDYRGMTALHCAVERLDATAVRLVLELKADVNQTDAKQNTPLHALLDAAENQGSDIGWFAAATLLWSGAQCSGRTRERFEALFQQQPDYALLERLLFTRDIISSALSSSSSTITTTTTTTIASWSPFGKPKQSNTTTTTTLRQALHACSHSSIAALIALYL